MSQSSKPVQLDNLSREILADKIALRKERAANRQGWLEEIASIEKMYPEGHPERSQLLTCHESIALLDAIIGWIDRNIEALLDGKPLPDPTEELARR